MLITNGKITRNIAEKQLSEYKAKGYEVVTVKTPEKSTEKKPSKKGDK